jgi:hypothetical protein
MLNSRNSLLVVVTLLVVCVTTTAQATGFTTSSLPPGRYYTDPTPEALSPQSITQSNDTATVVTGTSVHCPTAGVQTHWWRLFDLDDDHNLTGMFCAEDIDYGIESLAAAQVLTIRVHCLTEGMPFVNANLVLQSTTAVPHAPTSLTLHNAVLTTTGCCDSATEDMALQLSTAAPGFFVGCNNLGQSAPSFISASGAGNCGVPEPADLASIGFPNSHLLLVVNGDGETTGDGGSGDGVPASTNLGMLLMVLALLGSSAYFLRRKATNN